MATTSSNAIVNAPIETVWETLARFEDISQWGRGVDQSSLLTDGPPGLGSVRRVQVGRTTLRETITVWEPLQALGYRIEGLPPLVNTASNTWTLETTGTGAGTGTRVTLTGEVEAKGGPLPSRLVARLIGKAGKDLVAGLADEFGHGASA